MTENNIKKLHWFHSSPVSITTTNTAAVSDLVLNVFTLSAIGKTNKYFLCHKLIGRSQLIGIVLFGIGNSRLLLKIPQYSPYNNAACDGC